jgi:hypothetical protein
MRIGGVIKNEPPHFRRAFNYYFYQLKTTWQSTKVYGTFWHFFPLFQCINEFSHVKNSRYNEKFQTCVLLLLQPIQLKAKASIVLCLFSLHYALQRPNSYSWQHRDQAISEVTSKPLHAYRSIEQFFLCSTTPIVPRLPHCRGFTITLRYTTFDRTALDEWSIRRRDV